MSDILRHIKERFGQGPSKAKLQKEFFLMEQRKTESINQFAGWVEQRFKRLRALYPGRYDHGQLKERVSQKTSPKRVNWKIYPRRKMKECQRF